jgi:hypothetical protein
LLRAARNDRGERLIDRESLLLILNALESQPVTVDGKTVAVPASPALRAMVLLGLNAGFGNNDVASLPRSAVNLKTGWLTFPGPKTAIRRRVPLWAETLAETVAAIALAIAQRPQPKDPADADLCFLTERGDAIRADAIEQDVGQCVRDDQCPIPAIRGADGRARHAPQPGERRSAH